MSMIHEITATAGHHKAKRRKGRGESSRGKTSGRGNKGSKARNGKYIKPTYEGGQTELFRRFPIRGFNNVNFERKFYVVNLSDLESFDVGSTVDQSALMEKGLVPDDKLPVKILGNGEFTKKLTISAAAYSKSAFEKVGQLGGSAQNASGQAYELPKVKKKFVKRDKHVPAPGATAGGDSVEAPKQGD